jgi:hypothetical protein
LKSIWKVGVKEFIFAATFFRKRALIFQDWSLNKKAKKDLEKTQKIFYLCNAFFGPSDSN